MIFGPIEFLVDIVCCFVNIVRNVFFYIFPSRFLYKQRRYHDGACLSLTIICWLLRRAVPSSWGVVTPLVGQCWLMGSTGTPESTMGHSHHCHKNRVCTAGKRNAYFILLPSTDSTDSVIHPQCEGGRRSINCRSIGTMISWLTSVDKGQQVSYIVCSMQRDPKLQMHGTSTLLSDRQIGRTLMCHTRRQSIAFCLEVA